jgi:hypothetical protein
MDSVADALSAGHRLYLVMITTSKYCVEEVNGSIWSNRFLFFVTGVLVGAILYPIHCGQPFVLKVAVQLLRALSIIIVSVV